MKTRKATILLAGAAIACMAIMSGCSKSPIGLGGKAVRFETTSGGAQTTKTVYGKDSTVNNVKKQALNWVNGDVITIASPQAKVIDGANAGANASNYVVKNAVDGVPSKAKVSNESGNGLTWTDGFSSFDFYAVYPKVSNSITLTSDGAVTATIPATQDLTGDPTDKVVGEGDAAITYKEYKPDMNYAFMTAATEKVAPSTEENAVSLTFDPAFTAFEFNVSSQDEGEIELTAFEILSPNDGETVKRNDKLAGKFSMTAGDFSSIAIDESATQSIKVGMGDAKTVDDKTGLTFTVFALPVKNTDPLRIRFTSNEGDGSKTSWLDLKYSDDADKAGDNAGKALQFEAGHKYRINMLKLPSSQWKITIKPIFEEWIEAEDEVVIYI